MRRRRCSLRRMKIAQATIYNELIQLCSGEGYSIVSNYECGQQAWEALQTHYAPATEAAVTNIYERLTLTRVERNENASALVGHLESHFTALAHVGEKLSEAHKKSATRHLSGPSQIFTEHTIQLTDGEGLPDATRLHRRGRYTSLSTRDPSIHRVYGAQPRSSPPHLT
jgi:hypothetical protein